MRTKALLALLVMLLVSSCSQFQAQMDGAEVGGDDDVDQMSENQIETVSWANLNGMVSVLVRNTSDRVLQHAEAVITVQDEGDGSDGSGGTSTVEGRCCTAIDVPPGATFGFHLYNGGNVTGVQVDYKNIAWGSSGSEGAPDLDLRPVDLVWNSQGAVARAVVRSEGGPVDATVIQAVLNDADGKFVAVISGTWFCFEPSTPRTIRMQLYQRVPLGTKIASVRAFPKPSTTTGGDANSNRTCTPADDEGTTPPSEEATSK